MAVIAALAIFQLTAPLSQESQIRLAWQNLQPQYFRSPFVTQGSMHGEFKAGTLHPDFLQDGINFIKFVRFLAKLSYDVELEDSLNQRAQAGAVLLATLPEIQHSAPMPAGMNLEFYATASQGLKSGNLSRQTGSPANLPQLIFDQMWDNAENESHVGHRRWLLNPRLQKVGLGFFESNNRLQGDGVVLAHDMSRPFKTTFDHVAWPASGDFPLEFCPEETPWSVTLNPAIYQPIKADQVKIIFKTDSKVYSFEPKLNAKPTGSQAFSTINSQNFGVANAIIFRPELKHEYKTGQKVSVQISGLKLKDGTSAELNYTVRFFKLTS